MKLKPCPFCGAFPAMYENCSEPEFTIECVNQMCRLRVKSYICESEEAAIKLWNTRAEDIERKTLENRLKHLLQSAEVRLYDEIDPTVSGGYKRDISELDHLVFDSKREEKTAHWDICCDGYYPFCSHCGEAAQHMSRFCPNCGYRLVTRKHGDN